MSREQLIKRIAEILTPPHPLTADAAAALILDAVLPQITTIEQLEPLPELTKVIGTNGGAWEYSSYSSPHQWFGTNGDECSNSDLLENYGPLTVVWQPQGGGA